MKYLLILLLAGCSFEKDCYRSGAIVTIIHTVFPTYTTSQLDKKEPITWNCDMVTDTVIPISMDTLYNVNDTIIIKEKFYRFKEQP